MKYRIYDNFNKRFRDDIIVGPNGDFLQVKTSRDLGISLIKPMSKEDKYDLMVIECTKEVDVDGIDIYDGDLVKLVGDDDNFIYRVYYDKHDGKWVADCEEDPIAYNVDSEVWEVVGNIYNNLSEE